MSKELWEIMRADLKALNEIRARYDENAELTTLANNLQDEIARLEAEADPWREAKAAILLHIQSGGNKVKAVAEYALHLQTDNSWLTARVAELGARIERAGQKCNELYESKRNVESQYDKACKRLAELEAMDQFRLDPETGTLEVDHVGPEPTLDPARVLATSVEAIDVAGYMLDKHTKHNVKAVMRNASMYQKPYRLKGGGG